MPAGAPDELCEDSTLHGHARHRVEHHGAQVHKSYRLAPETNGPTLQGKRWRRPGEKTARRVKHVEGRRPRTAHGGSSIHPAPAAAIEANPTHIRAHWPFDTGGFIALA